MIKQLTVAAPRGFCAGVDRAVKIVEVSLEKFGQPVYVRHEIVHNKTVVDGLAAKGAIFVSELDEVPEGAPVVFSAHGVSRAVVATADERRMIAVDATCPLVTKVHNPGQGGKLPVNNGFTEFKATGDDVRISPGEIVGQLIQARYGAQWVLEPDILAVDPGELVQITLVEFVEQRSEIIERCRHRRITRTYFDL